MTSDDQGLHKLSFRRFPHALLVRQHIHPRKSLVIFDADDTLWLTAILYKRALEDIQQLITNAGLDGTKWRDLHNTRDIALIQSFHFSKDHFPSAAIASYVDLATASGIPPDPKVIKKINARARQVATDKAEKIEGIAEALKVLGKDHYLVLVSKGDPDTQVPRIRKSRLGPYFDGVVIVTREKDAALFSKICQDYQIDPSQAISVGNSLPSDINPALAAGLGGVLLSAEHVWKYEEREKEPIRTDRLRNADSAPELVKAVHDLSTIATRAAPTPAGPRGAEIAA